MRPPFKRGQELAEKLIQRLAVAVLRPQKQLEGRRTAASTLTSEGGSAGEDVMDGWHSRHSHAWTQQTHVQKQRRRR